MYTVEVAVTNTKTGNWEWELVCEIGTRDKAISFALAHANSYRHLCVKDQDAVIAHIMQPDFPINFLADTHPIDQLIEAYLIDRDVMAQLCREWLEKYDEQKGNENA